ncbi:MAG TPA: hypothetical protein VFZ21_25185 [Gemmatimonadaceae bacterium]|jgi:hypothetical protein|nr:hypothetical protein [Gemmatimonadaceae bacterium]
MFTVEVDEFRVLCVPDGLPSVYSPYRERAALVEEFALDDADAGRQSFLGVAHVGEDWPFLVVAQRFEPAGYGFEPGVLIVPDTGRLFLGAGTRLLAYDLTSPPRRLWADAAEIGFWGWARHNDIVLMSAELELAAWDLEGRKLWTTFVEPPWTYTVRDGVVVLDVMGTKSEFSARTGPVSHPQQSPNVR